MKDVVLTHEFNVSETFFLKCAVQVHGTLEGLRDAFIELEGATGAGDELAFCHYDPKSDKDLIATVHLCLPQLRISYIAHEAFHAALILMRKIRINFDEEQGEELLASAAGNITREIVLACMSKDLEFVAEELPEPV